MMPVTKELATFTILLLFADYKLKDVWWISFLGKKVPCVHQERLIFRCQCSHHVIEREIPYD